MRHKDTHNFMLTNYYRTYFQLYPAFLQLIDFLALKWTDLGF